MKILLLGSSGKMGTAIRKVFGKENLILKNSKDFDALNLESVNKVLNACSPEIIINTVAYMGIDDCEKYPEKALRINTLYPKYLAQYCYKKNIIFINFSTDAVFDGKRRKFYTENDIPLPVNIYGYTKLGADIFIQNKLQRYYLIRIPILFGPYHKDTQFVEKMLKKGITDKNIKIANDIFSSPTFSIDIAKQIKKLIKQRYDFGLYHVANAGVASLYEFFNKIVEALELNIKIEEGSYKDFPFIGEKNLYTPLKSVKIAEMQKWEDAVKEYCINFLKDYKK